VKCDCKERLIAWCTENGIAIGGCGCCGSPWVTCAHGYEELSPDEQDEMRLTVPTEDVPPGGENP